MPTLFLRTIITYFFLLIAMRIGGKRQIGELQLSELITALLLSDLAVSPISREDTPLLFGLIPIVTVICLEIICAFLATKSNLLKRFFDGVPSVIIKKGKLDIGELSKLRMGVEEFISETRQQGVRDLSDVEYAILEADGKLSVFEKPNSSNGASGIAHVVIADGKLNKHGISSLGLDENAVRTHLAENGLSLSSVFLLTVSDHGKETLILRSGKTAFLTHAITPISKKEKERKNQNK